MTAASLCGQEDHDVKAIIVRFVISDITPNSVRFEQVYLDDGGRSRETNWIEVDTRVGMRSGVGSPTRNR